MATHARFLNGSTASSYCAHPTKSTYRLNFSPFVGINRRRYPCNPTAKRPDPASLFFSNGLTWKQRQSDLRKIIDFQNNGDIARIFILAMASQFEADLTQLNFEFKL